MNVEINSNHENGTDGVITDKIMDPKIDIIFKELFGHNSTNFINLTNAVLELKGDNKIKSVEFLNSEMSKETPEDPGAIHDAFLGEIASDFLNTKTKNYKIYQKNYFYNV